MNSCVSTTIPFMYLFQQQVRIQISKSINKRACQAWLTWWYLRTLVSSNWIRRPRRQSLRTCVRTTLSWSSCRPLWHRLGPSLLCFWHRGQWSTLKESQVWTWTCLWDKPRDQRPKRGSLSSQWRGERARIYQRVECPWLMEKSSPSGGFSCLESKYTQACGAWLWCFGERRIF